MSSVVVKAGGIRCKSDIGLVHQSTALLLSIYGSPQQVKALFALLADGKTLTVERKDDAEGVREFEIERLPSTDQMGLCFRGSAVGYGKQHGLIWAEALRDHIVWTATGGEDAAVLASFAKRKIPVLPEWISSISGKLCDLRVATPLWGWGGAGGYWCNWDDDKVCSFLVANCLGGHGAARKARLIKPVQPRTVAA